VDRDEAAIAAINSVPAPAVSDAGKVLTVNTEDVTETVVVAPEPSIRLKTSGATFTVNLVTLAAGDTVTINGELWGDHKLDTLPAVEVELVEEQGELLAIYVGDTYVYTFAIGEGGVASVVNDDTHTTLGDQFSLEHFTITTAVTTTEASAGWNALPTEVPTPAIADAGKAIVVNNSGEYALDNVGGGGALVCTRTENTLDKTWNEIYTAMASGIVVILVDSYEGFFSHYYATECNSNVVDHDYTVMFIGGARGVFDHNKIYSNADVYAANSATGTLTRAKHGEIEYT
jgi:hypothetical protein